MRKISVRTVVKCFYAQRRLFKSRLVSPLHGWRANYRFSALVMLFILPVTCLAKRRVERRLATDLYVMF